MFFISNNLFITELNIYIYILKYWNIEMWDNALEIEVEENSRWIKKGGKMVK